MYDLSIPRHACTPRDTARAGDLWRLVQEAAVLHSSACGWPPERYRQAGTGFVVREMLGLHVREAIYGENLRTRTWVAESRRELIMRRETALGEVLRTSAQWVHIGDQGAPKRAPPELANAFPVELTPDLHLPEFVHTATEELPTFLLSPWWTEMDPLGHTNHPRYVDWVDEALSRWLSVTGRDPVLLRPVAEQLRFRTSASAGQQVHVRIQQIGVIPGGGAFRFQIDADGVLAVNGTVLRAFA